MTLSLIIATYNRPDALELVLKSLLHQSSMPEEVIIADDGSAPETARLIEGFKRLIPCPVHHIWHADQGFRLSAIRNKAIAASTGAYIVQIDGDVLMHPHFILDHRRFAMNNCFVRASRIYLNDTLTKRLLATKSVRPAIFNRGLTNKTSALRLPFLWKYFATGYKSEGLERFEIHGCNMAFWREQALTVNGYNEDFEGWGYEDKEFVARLLAAGYKRRFLKMGGIVYHLHHALNSRNQEIKNGHLLKQTIDNHYSWCPKGIDQYLPTNGKNLSENITDH